MLSVRHVFKNYGNLEILKDINLTIEEGEVVAMVGVSGAGKSTLLQLIGALDKPDKGEIWFRDKAVHTFSAKKIAQYRNENIGFVFQFHHLLPEFSALENVCLPAMIRKTPKSVYIKRAQELLSYLNLSHREHHKPNELSGGEQQRVAVARALINQPALILADEPSGNLDTQNSESLHQLFFTLAKDFNQAFFIATHNDVLAQQSHRCLRIVDGSIVG